MPGHCKQAHFKKRRKIYRKSWLDAQTVFVIIVILELQYELVTLKPWLDQTQHKTENHHTLKMSSSEKYCKMRLYCCRLNGFAPAKIHIRI